MNKIFTTAFIALMFACKGEDTMLVSSTVQSVKVFDVGNQMDASDIRVEFRLFDNSNTGDFWIVLAKSNPSNPVTSEFILSMTNTQYTVQQSTSEIEYSVRVASNQLDTDGDPINDGLEYQAYVFTSQVNVLSSPSTKFTLVDEPVLNGDYVGLWNDNLYNDFPVSARISTSSTIYSGDFYYSGNYQSCCGGADDGRISFRINGDSINDFRYNQDLLNFMSGCTGQYNGSGLLVDDITLVISFSGNDCEGPHTNGSLVLKKDR